VNPLDNGHELYYLTNSVHGTFIENRLTGQDTPGFYEIRKFLVR